MTTFSSQLGFQPTKEQEAALAKINAFVDETSSDDFFILRGSAGTGKTSIVKAITEQLRSDGKAVRIGAPTARAAKIIGAKTGQQSKTMHSQIYTPEAVQNGGGVRLIRRQNTDTDKTFFIVDEASMISDTLTRNENFFVKKPLLTDYLEFVKQGNSRNKVLFIGDIFQLPPVTPGVDIAFSPALHTDYLSGKFGFDGDKFELSQVMRQAEGSNVLELATAIRDTMAKGGSAVNKTLPKVANATQAINLYLSLYEDGVLDKTTIICWANKDVNWWNSVLRQRLGYTGHIAVRDFVTTQANWFSPSDWIFKGDTGIIKSLDSKIESYADLHFVEAEIEFGGDAGGKKLIRTKVLLESLSSDSGSLSPEQENQLFHKVMTHNAKFRDSKKPSDDPYIGAMRLRHGYATTCHKAQGGEWDNIILHPYQPKDLRWLYTAVTRARQDAYSWAA
jgi:exodeoxyribonuclease V